MEPGFARAGDGLMPELPLSDERWTTRRKAALVGAVRRAEVSLDEICQKYRLSIEEFAAWERDYDRYGAPGLRATRYQIYRQTETRKAG